ncbi:MAG: hypothetical protein QOH63_3434 [Acidobacteriota bacterium]|nr:hypothetical protein [Acidobacteriota bacterium]
MKSQLSCRMLVVSSCCLLFVFALFVAPEALGQDIRLPLVAAPPPMKFVPRSERTQLSSAHDAKSRTRATIELAEARLSRAEELTASEQFEAASAELGVYQGLIDDAIYYLGATKAGKDKMRDTYKRLELALRAHCSRIEAIRRITPSEFAVNIKAICECTRHARAEALNGFYGDTVLGEVSREDEKNSGGELPKDSTTGSVKKQ